MSNTTRLILESLVGDSPISVWGNFRVSLPECSLDLDLIKRALSVMVDSEHAFEIRALFSSQKMHTVVCRNLDDGVTAVAEHASAQAIYVCLNPIADGARSATKKTVINRRWLLIDVDPIRAKDCSSTEDEKAAGLEIVAKVMDFLRDRGWPNPVVNDSGNGWHLLYRIDMPNDDLSQQIVKSVLYALAERFDTPEAKIDRSTHDAPRICKIPGTWARKGLDTPERPHRLAVLGTVPEKLEVVSAELLSALASTPESVPGVDPWSGIKIGGERSLDTYVSRAIEGECGKLSLSLEGTRNAALNRGAFVLGTLASWPEMRQDEAREALARTARQIGLDDHEIARAIENGWSAGIGQPRTRPDQPAQEHQGKNGVLKPGQFIIWASKVVPTKVDWLDPGRIPLGKMTTFAGQTGLGKTFAVCDIAARVTIGGPIPLGGGACYPQGKVLIISAEDDASDTIVPRFMELGGDRSKLALLSPACEEKFALASLDLLNGCLADMGPGVKLVAIDPPTSYLGRTDDHKNAELRGLLAPLSRWARDNRVALLFVTHVNKPSANKLEAIARVMGGSAWVQGVRSAQMFCPDPMTPGRRLYLNLKVNNAKDPKGLAYEIAPSGQDLAVIRWIEEVDLTADEAMGGTMPRKSAGVSAVEWLSERFRESREWKSADLKRMATDAGLTFNQVFKSAEVNALPILKRPKTNANGECYWVWVAKEKWPAQKPTETSDSPKVEEQDVVPY